MESLIFKFDQKKIEDLLISKGFSLLPKKIFQRSSLIYSDNEGNRCYVDIKYFKNKKDLYYCSIDLATKSGMLNCDWWPAHLAYIDGQLNEINYYKNGSLYRDNNLPTIVYYENGKPIIELWYDGNTYHRPDGPAFIDYKSDMEEYYILGKKYKKDYYYNIINSVKDDSIKNKLNMYKVDNLKNIKSIAEFYNKQDIIEAIENRLLIEHIAGCK